MTIKQHIRYEVLSEPSPEYLEGKPGRNGIYTVVKLVDDLPPEIIKVFDGHPSSQSREDAYAHARELNERRRQELETLVLVPLVEDLKYLSIADATEIDRLRAEIEMLKARQIPPEIEQMCEDFIGQRDDSYPMSTRHEHAFAQSIGYALVKVVESRQQADDEAQC